LIYVEESDVKLGEVGVAEQHKDIRVVLILVILVTQTIESNNVGVEFEATDLREGL
jgi:hypothetical protein